MVVAAGVECVFDKLGLRRLPGGFIQQRRNGYQYLLLARLAVSVAPFVDRVGQHPVYRRRLPLGCAPGRWYLFLGQHPGDGPSAEPLLNEETIQPADYGRPIFV